MAQLKFEDAMAQLENIVQGLEEVVESCKLGRNPGVLRKNLIRLAVVDFLTSVIRPWGHELLVPFSLPCPHRHGSFERLPGS